ncbi:hypothetical protein C8R43DRAFT_1236573 [Mycena crocata]|nr:hypothetical protein C8R43DRAFT_1236573 [Mycena crocata]
MFSDTSPISPFAVPNRSSSISSHLLVCKSWLRVATPLLYAVVIIRTSPQASALQTALQSAPELGPFVKKLRIEGVFGKKRMHELLKQTPNVTDLFLSLLDGASAQALPALEFLSLQSPGTLSGLNGHCWRDPRLPSLRHLEFNLAREEWDGLLLRKHGAKIQQLEIPRGTVGNRSVLVMCPNLTLLTCELKAYEGYDVGCSNLDDGFRHSSLNKLVVNKYYAGSKAKDEKEWEAFFQRLSYAQLPVLREIQCLPLQWPTTENRMAASDESQG